MPRRKRSDPFDEGYLRVIYERFFKRIVDVHCPHDKTHREFLEDLFDIDNRHIENWEVKRSFVMPGLLCVSGNIKIQGIGYRKVSKGASMISRRDDLFPNEIQVDFFGGQGGAEHVYSLNREEWEFVKFHLDSLEEECPTIPNLKQPLVQ